MRHFKRFATLALTTVSVVCLTGSAEANNIVLNGNFATGDLTSWTANSPLDASNGPTFSQGWSVQAAGVEGNPFPGDTYFASVGCIAAICITGTTAQQASLMQSLTTTIGGTYTLTFEFTTSGHGAPNELLVLWNGSSVLDLGPGGTLGSVPNYTLYTVTGLVATSTSTNLTFLGRQESQWSSLADVDVEQVTPEPATWMLIGGALPLLAALRRLRA